MRGILSPHLRGVLLGGMVAVTLVLAGAARASDDLVTFLGHATVVLQLDDTRIIIDPLFTPGYSPIHRRFIPEPLDSLWRDIDAILISHAHPDHLDPTTLARFPANVPIYLSRSAARHVLELGHPVRMLHPGEAARVGNLTVIAVAAFHPGGRASLEPDSTGGALGYVVQSRARMVYLSGDSQIWSGFQRVGERFAPDLAILNINAHLNGDDAVRAVVDLGAPPVIAVHHGAYKGPNERAREKRHTYLEGILGPLFWAPEVGDRLDLTGISENRAESVAAFSAATQAERKSP